MKIEQLVRFNFDRLLKSRSMTQAEVAKKYPGKRGSVEPNYISQIINSEKLTLRAITNLAKTFGVEESELVKIPRSESPRVSDLLEKVENVLTSEDHDIAEALEKNINQFFKSVKRDQEFNNIMDYCKKLEQRIRNIEDKESKSDPLKKIKTSGSSGEMAI